MRAQLKRLSLMATLAMLTGLLGVMPAGAEHNDDIHSGNVNLLKRKPIKAGDVNGLGSDLAFNGKKMYAGSYSGTALYKIRSKKKKYIKQIGYHACPGSQGDISFVGKTVFVSIDAPASNNVENASCNNTKATGFTEADKSTNLEGIRVVDFSNPKQPT